MSFWFLVFRAWMAWGFALRIWFLPCSRIKPMIEMSVYVRQEGLRQKRKEMDVIVKLRSTIRSSHHELISKVYKSRHVECRALPS